MTLWIPHRTGADATSSNSHLDRAILQTKAETDAMGKSHTDLANLMRAQEAHVGDFLTKRENSRKSVSQTQAYQLNSQMRDRF